METAVTVPNPARSRLAPLPKKGSSTVTHSYAAEAPVSIITSSPSAPSTSAQSSALPLAPPMPVAAPAPLQPASFSHAPSPAPAPPPCYSQGAWRSLTTNSCRRSPPHTWSKEASLSKKVSSSHPFVLLFIHPCNHGVNSGAFQLPLSHLPFIKSSLKPFLAYHPSIPTWLASARLAANSIITFSPVHLLPPWRRQPLMTLWVLIHLLLPPMVDQTCLGYLRIMKSPFSLRWWTTALTSLSPLKTLIDCLRPKFRDLKTNYFHSLFHLQPGLPLLSLSNTFMNNLTPTLPHNRRTESSMPLLPSLWALQTIRTPDMLSTPI